MGDRIFRRTVLTTGVALLALAACHSGSPGAGMASGDMGGLGSEWTVLFDGTNLEQWSQAGGANWRLDRSDGSVTADMGTEGFLVTRSVYRDFELVLDFWVESATNSGVYIRSSDPRDPTSRNSYEVNIRDEAPNPDGGTASVIGVSPPSEPVRAGGRWNTYVIRADGPRLTVTLNGVQTVDAEDSTHSEGYIALQFSVGPVKFRNVRIREI